MYIGEIPDGSSIEINVTNGDKKISLCTFARTPQNPVDEKMVQAFFKKYRFGSGTLADAIERDGKFVGFHLTEDSEMHVYCIVDKKPYAWTEVKIIVAAFKKDNYYLIMSNQNAKESNRRAGYRQWVGHDGNLKLGLEPGSRDVVVKDISTGGIGLVVDGEVAPRIGETVHITYTDKVRTSNGLPKEFNFSLKAIVARKDDSDPRRTVIGCQFDKPNETVGQYINLKQIEHKQSQRVPPRR
ncbi:MAG: PilZ domain-containing protein [Lachnospiraceae bacterium]|nr:PilZ domain-containing protein [Lachnospiraceae bacterium]